MTYDGKSPITGTGIVTAAAIDAWFAVEGQKEGRYRYAPDKRYKPAPAIGNSIVGYAGIMGINSDLAAAQCLKESAAWQSAIARDKRNPAGLGAENSDSTGTAYDKAITFLTPDMGIRAQIAHLADYAIGKGSWTQYDPRASAMPASSFGIAKSLNGLDGRWATPGIGYGADVAHLANDLVTFAQTGETMAGDDPRFQWTPDTDEFGYPQGTHGRNGQPIELLILHITAGTDSQAWLLGRHGSSTHYLTNKDGTPRAQHVAEADAAWTPGSSDYALRSINVEVEMLKTSDWTDAIMREVARTVAPIMQRHGIPAVYLGRDAGPGKKGMIGHRDVPDPNKPGQWGGSSNHDDPGANFDWRTFAGYVAAEMAGGVMPPDSGATALVTQPDPHGSRFWIPTQFLSEIKLQDWLLTGICLTEAFAEGDQIVQYFERARLELNKDGTVTRGLVGAEALYAKYPNRRAA